MENTHPEERLSQAEAAALYDRLAGVYDLWSALTETRARRRLLALADVGDGDSVLEVAPGTGAAFAAIVAGNPEGRNVGLDLSRRMLGRTARRLGKRGLTNFALIEASALAVPLAGAAFDVVVCGFMLDLLPAGDRRRALAEFHRLLRPRGRLALAAMTVGERPGSGLYEAIARRAPRLMGGCRGVQMASEVAAAGFALERRDYLQQMLFPAEVILARKS